LNVRRFNLVGPQQETYNASDNTPLIMYSPEAGIFNNPLPANVREGIVYGPGGALVGTFAQTVSPSLAQIADAVPSVEEISTQMERTGSPLKATSDTIAAVKTRLENTATTEVVQQIVADTLGAL